MTFTRTHTAAKRGTSTYTSEDGRVLYLPKSVSDHPETIEVEGLSEVAEKAPRAPKVPGETKEERKAHMAARSPEQVEADKKAAGAAALERATKRAQKLGLVPTPASAQASA